MPGLWGYAKWTVVALDPIHKAWLEQNAQRLPDEEPKRKTMSDPEWQTVTVEVDVDVQLFDGKYKLSGTRESIAREWVEAAIFEGGLPWQHDEKGRYASVHRGMIRIRSPKEERA